MLHTRSKCGFVNVDTKMIKHFDGSTNQIIFLFVFFIYLFFLQIIMSSTAHLISLIAITVVGVTSAWRPCPELSPLLKFPCRCNVETQATDKEHLEVSIDCDGVVFNEDQPQFPYNAPIVSFWQRDSGQQRLSLQVGS